MESQNQNIKQFKARRHVILLIIICIIAFFIMLMFPVETNVCVGVPIILIFIRAIWQFNMIYIEIGDDYIIFIPTAPLGSAARMLFEEISSISYQKNKVIINYKNEISHNEHTVKIPLTVMENKEKEKLLTTLHTVLKDKEQ